MSITDHNGGAGGYLPEMLPEDTSTAKAIAHQYGLWMRHLDGEVWEEAASRFYSWIVQCEDADLLNSSDWWSLFTFAANKRPRLLELVDELFPERPATAKEYVQLRAIDGGKAEPSKPSKASSPDFLAFWDGDEQPKPTPSLIKRVLPLDGVVLLGGRSGAGKSYLALYMSVCLAAQIPFFGHQPRMQSNVLYVAAEGGSNMVPRLAAAKQAAGITERLPIRIIRRASFPSDEATFTTYLEHVAAEAQAMRDRTGIQQVVIPIDTVSAAFEVGDENDAAKITALCKRARRIAERCKPALVVLIHHFGKDEDRLFRGSSAWRDNVDHAFSIITERSNKTAETVTRNLNIEKSRLGPEGKLTGYKLVDTQIGLDEDGDPWTEAAVEQAKYKPIAKAEDEKKLGRGGKVFNDSFAEAMNGHGTDHSVGIGGPDRQNVHAVHLLRVKEEFMRRYPTDNPKTAAKAWEREMKAIGDRGLGFSTETDRYRTAWIWRADLQKQSMVEEFNQNVQNVPI